MNQNTRFDKDTRLFISASSAPGSRGTFFYNHFFRLFGINAAYLSRKVSDPEALVSSIRTLGISGCSVSMPLKSRIIPFLDEIDPRAAGIGSVNTVVNHEGRLKGYNTDWSGFVMPIKNRGVTPRTALVFGYGSVVNTVVAGLREISPEVRIEITGRDPATALLRSGELGADVFSGRVPDIFINAAPVAELPDGVAEVLKRSPVFFDLPVRNAVPSMGRNGIEGMTDISGLEMFQWQFLEQFRIYTGIEIDPSAFNSAAAQSGV